MKKWLLGIVAAAAMIIGFTGCTDSKNYKMYMYNGSPFTINGWGAIDYDTEEIYQLDTKDDRNFVYPYDEKGPLSIPKEHNVFFAVHLLGYNNWYYSDKVYYIDCDFTFEFYSDGYSIEPRALQTPEEIEEFVSNMYMIGPDGEKVRFHSVEDSKLDIYE